MVDFVIANWKDLALIGTSCVTIASIVVKLTPTDKDDKILTKFLKIIAFDSSANK